MNIQQTAVDKAIAFLNAAGAVYRIQLGESFLVDTFPKAPVAKRQVVNDWDKLTGYIKLIKELPAGQELTITQADRPEFAEKKDWNSFQASFGNGCKRLLPADTYVYEGKNGHVSLLKV